MIRLCPSVIITGQFEGILKKQGWTRGMDPELGLKDGLGPRKTKVQLR